MMAISNIVAHMSDTGDVKDVLCFLRTVVDWTYDWLKIKLIKLNLENIKRITQNLAKIKQSLSKNQTDFIGLYSTC